MEGWCLRKQLTAWELGHCLACFGESYSSHRGRPRCRVGVDRLEQSTSKLEGVMELAFVLAEVQVASCARADGLAVALVIECL